MQNALKDDNATQVCCNFFGDGTANNGEYSLCQEAQQVFKEVVRGQELSTQILTLLLRLCTLPAKSIYSITPQAEPWLVYCRTVL